MDIKVKYPHLLKFIIGLLQSALAFYMIYHYDFLKMIGYIILLISLESIKRHIKQSGGEIGNGPLIQYEKAQVRILS